MAREKNAGALSEAAAIGRHVHDFCWDWAPSHLTGSEHTLKAYRTSLRLYVEWLATTGVTPRTLSASDFGAEMVERWLVWLATERGNAPQTCNNRLSSLRKFLTYVSRHDATMAHLEAEVAAVPLRKAAKTKVRGLSRDAVRALTHAPGTSTRQGVRDTTVMVVLYATACRVGELLSMRVSQLHLDADRPYALLVGKGGKSRVAYLPERAVGHVRAYLGEFHAGSPDPDAYLLWSRNHREGTHPLSDDAVTRLLRKHAKTAHAECAEVPTDVTSHRLRHARASHWLEDGLSVAQISLLLGHASVQTTMDYLDITVDAQSEAMQAMSVTPSAGECKWHTGEASSLLELCGFGRK